MFERVIVPLDGSAVSEKALSYGVEIARRFGARLVLLRAFAGREQSTRTLAMMPTEPAGGVTDPRAIELIEESAEQAGVEAAQYLRAKAAELSGGDSEVDTVHVDDTAADAILTEANRGPGALVVMCTHGRGGLSRLVFGSTAQEVLHKCQAPILLIRVYESTHLESGGNRGMDISIGADVVGSEGKLGEVHRVIVDARSERVTDLVVKHGFVFGRERVVPLSHVQSVENGVVHLDLDQRGFEAMDGFAEDRFRAPDPNWIGPPGYARESFVVDTMVAEGPMMGVAGGPGPALGFPGGEQSAPDDMARPTIQPGTPVLDMDGNKVGEVHEMSFSTENGAPPRLVVRSGGLFHHDTELPASMVREIADDGVMLNVGRAEVERLGERR